MTTPSEGEGPMDPQSETVRVPSPDRTSTPADAKAPTQSLTWRSPGLWIVIGIAVLTLALAVFI